MDPRHIARIVHEANRALQHVQDDPVPSPPWDLAGEDIRASAVDGVQNALDGASPEESHRNWLEFKAREGWTWGQTKDFDAKTHPCMVDYEELPPEQRVKDHLFVSIVQTLKDA